MRFANQHRTQRARLLRLRATRRILGEGAIGGLVLGVGAQFFVGDSLHGTHEWLVRLALMLPAIVFLGWWIVSPGLHQEESALAESGEHNDHTLSLATRVEQVFDSAAVPRGHHVRLTEQESSEDFASSIRRSPKEMTVSAEEWGLGSVAEGNSFTLGE